jgi:hypothetical protein
MVNWNGSKKVEFLQTWRDMRIIYTTNSANVYQFRFMTTLWLPKSILLALASLKIVSNGERAICSEAPSTKDVADTQHQVLHLYPK